MMVRTPGGSRELGSWLGLARRAGALVTGTFATRQALREDRVKLVLLATDASEGSRRKVLGLVEGKGVPCRTVGTRSELGAAVGESPRSAVGVVETSFAEQLLRRVSGSERVRRVGKDGR